MYFDFISCSQYLTVSKLLESKLPKIFEEFCEVPSENCDNGKRVIMRPAALGDDSSKVIPLIYEGVGDRIVDGLINVRGPLITPTFSLFLSLIRTFVRGSHLHLTITGFPRGDIQRPHPPPPQPSPRPRPRAAPPIFSRDLPSKGVRNPGGSDSHRQHSRQREPASVAHRTVQPVECAAAAGTASQDDQHVPR